MPRKANEHRSTRIVVRPATTVAAYLDEIASVGFYGKTRAEVAERLIGLGIAQLLKDGVIAEARGAQGKRHKATRSKGL